MLKIWGRISSVNVQKVVWCVEELGLAYERIDVGGRFGGLDTPQYLAMNPSGLVPVLEEDGFALPESNAIVRYLAARDPGGTLWPAQPRERAEVDRWMEWQSTGYTPAMWMAFRQLIRTPEEQRDAAAIEASRAKSEKHSAILDARLAAQPWLAGERFSAADIVVGCAAHRWLNLPLAREPRPHLERWYARLKERPASRQVTSLALS
ncbi:MAG TPA: glutathione S-transferase family protein [Myxococcota bacterium]|nr:glutathione S-transferase family protein [Myxococcota bacterium]